MYHTHIITKNHLITLFFTTHLIFDLLHLGFSMDLNDDHV